MPSLDPTAPPPLDRAGALARVDSVIDGALHGYISTTVEALEPVARYLAQPAPAAQPVTIDVPALTWAVAKALHDEHHVKDLVMWADRAEFDKRQWFEEAARIVQPFIPSQPEPGIHAARPFTTESVGEPLNFPSVSPELAATVARLNEVLTLRQQRGCECHGLDVCPSSHAPQGENGGLLVTAGRCACKGVTHDSWCPQRPASALQRRLGTSERLTPAGKESKLHAIEGILTDLLCENFHQLVGGRAFVEASLDRLKEAV